LSVAPTTVHRRTVVRGVFGLVGVSALGSIVACAHDTRVVGPTSQAVAAAEAARRIPGQSVVTARLSPQLTTLDLGGLEVDTWAYGDRLPGPLIRATAGDLLSISVDNRLAVDTSVHCHGIALRNDMDGVPGITQDPIAPGETYDYKFTAPDPGTYFYHPHSGVQLDRGLYGVLLIDDPAEPGDYDDEWVIVLDDWVDGTGQTADDVLADLKSGGASHGSMGGMGGSGDGSRSLGHGGDVVYPHYLINGRIPKGPVSFTGKPGQRIRLRVVNAGSDTAFRLALGGHELTVTHSDGFPVVPTATDAILVGMGERYDVTITLAEGVFALVASAEGKTGAASAVVRTTEGDAPAVSTLPELGKRVLLGTDLVVAEQVRLSERKVDREHELVLRGSMSRYEWTINGRSFPDHGQLAISEGERVRLRFTNESMMFHPMHVHGHTFALSRGGARKDTVIVRPMASLDVELDANNPGQWMTHCHNIYHAESGMMTTLSYQS
jgi:multicopper oxidase